MLTAQVKRKNFMAALPFGKSVILIRFYRASETEHGFPLMIFVVIHILFCVLSLFNKHLNVEAASAAHDASKRLD